MQTIKESDERCRGCRILFACTMKPELNSRICPCVNCLIKVLCENDCKEEIEYVNFWEDHIRKT
jgi:hypothetical protein